MSTNQNNKGLQKRTKTFALQAIELFKGIPKTDEGRIIGKQFLRAATSVGANSRAAFRARSSKEFLAKAGIVIEEADESGFWLEMMEESKTWNHESVEKLRKESEEIVSVFVSIVKKHKNF